MKLSIVVERDRFAWLPTPYSAPPQRPAVLQYRMPDADYDGAAEVVRIVRNVLEVRDAFAATQVAAAKSYVGAIVDQLSPHAAARVVAAVESIALEEARTTREPRR